MAESRALLAVILIWAGGCASASPVPLVPRGSEVAAQVEAGNAARRYGDLDAASEAFALALDRDPQSIKAHVGVQDLMRAQGRELDVRRLYRALDVPFLSGRLEGASSRSAQLLGRAEEPYRSIGLGELAYRDGNAKRAASLFRNAVAIDPGEVWGWIGLGRAELSLGNYGTAFVAFTTATWNAPEHPSAWYGRSLAAQRLGHGRIAFESALRSAALAPMDEAAVAQLSSAARRLGGADSLRGAAETLGRVGEGRSADALLEAASLWADAGSSENMNGSLAAAVKIGALQAELEAAAPPPEDATTASFVRSFSSGVRARYRHFRATGESETLHQFVAWARSRYESVTGEVLAPTGSYVTYPFVGKLVDPTAESDEPLVRRLAEQDLLLVLGQRAGGPPEAILARIIRRSGTERVRSRGETVDREAIWIGERYLSGYLEWAGGGDIAGLALGSVVLIDLHAAARWEGAIRRRRERLRPYAGLAMVQQALDDAPAQALDDPAGVSDRLLFGSDLDMAAEILVHEDAHLVDAARFLPVKRNLLRGFGLALSHGFQAAKVVAHLERNAQLTAICEGPHPRAAFAICCASLGGYGSHAIGYRAIVEGFVAQIQQHAIDYPAIDTSRVIVQQLHLLSDEEIRTLACRLARRWGVAPQPATAASRGP